MLFHKQRKRDQPAGRSRSHDVFETGEFILPGPHVLDPAPPGRRIPGRDIWQSGRPGGESPGPQGIMSLRRGGETPGRGLSLLSGRAGRRKPGTQFRRTFSRQGGENPGRELRRTFGNRPCGRRKPTELCRETNRDHPGSHSSGASPECLVLLLL